MKALIFLLKFGYRNLWRSPKRTVIMLMSLSLGTGFIIWNLNFANSGSKETMKEFLSQYAGHYHITHPEYYDAENKRIFNNYKTISDQDISDPGLLTSSTQRVTAPVFLSGEKKTLGVLLTGIDVQKELGLSAIHKGIKEGRFIAPMGDKELVLGKKLAQRIEVQIGDEVAVIGQALDGSVANDLMTVVGLLDWGGGDLEESLAFTQIASARELIAMAPERFHQRVSFDLSVKELPVLQGVAVTKWDELLPEMGVSVRFIDNFTWVVAVIIVLVVNLGLSNTLMVTFFEREQEFQCLNILGAKGSWVAKALMIEVFMMGTLAILFGGILGHLATMYCYYNPVNIQLFTGGTPIIMGGMLIQPLVRFYPDYSYYWKIPTLIYCFLALTMIYPVVRVMHRRKNAI